MERQTDVIYNWILEQKATEIYIDVARKLDVLYNLENEISLRVREFENSNERFKIKVILGNLTDTVSENEMKKEIDLQHLPFYFPPELSAKRISSSLNHTQNTQRWIGYVIEKNDKKFKAKLEDITNPGTFEIGTFDIKDSIDEQEMIQLGAVFYLSVGYDVSKGTRAKQKLIRFQRLYEWTEDDFNNAIDRADRIASNFGWE
jgi:hypothetical protein